MGTLLLPTRPRKRNMGIHVTDVLRHQPVGTHLVFVGHKSVYRKKSNEKWLYLFSDSTWEYEEPEFQNAMETQRWALL